MVVSCTYPDCKSVFSDYDEMIEHKLDDPHHNYCKKCDIDCEDYDDYLQHKVEAMYPWLYETHAHLRTKAPKHICCEFCGIDFKSFGGRRVHREERHKAVQQIGCPGCKCYFTSANYLISHIERDKCPGISADDFTRALQWKHMLEVIMRNPGVIAQNLDFCAASGGDFEMETEGAKLDPVTLLDDHEGREAFKTKPLEPTADLSQMYTWFADNHEWPKLPSWDDSKFAHLTLEDDQSTVVDSSKGRESRSKKSKKRAKHRRPRIVDRNLLYKRFWDPDSGDYNRSIFYHLGAEKYLCPFKDCCTAYDEPEAIDNHFKTHHMQIRHQCRSPSCFKIFETAAALVAHVEKSAKCKVRETESYKHILDHITGGLLKAESLPIPTISEIERALYGPEGTRKGLLPISYSAQKPEKASK